MKNNDYIKLKNLFSPLLLINHKQKFHRIQHYYLDLEDQYSLLKRQAYTLDSFEEKRFFIRKYNEKIFKFIQENELSLEENQKMHNIAYSYYRFLDAMIKYTYDSDSSAGTLENFYRFAVRVIEVSFILSFHFIKLADEWFNDQQDFYQSFFLKSFFIDTEQIAFKELELDRIIIGSTDTAYPYIAIDSKNEIVKKYYSTIRFYQTKSNDPFKKLLSFFKHKEKSQISNVYYCETFSKIQKESNPLGHFDLLPLDDPLREKYLQLDRSFINSKNTENGILEINHESDIEKIARIKTSFQTNKQENIVDAIDNYNDSVNTVKDSISSSQKEKIKKNKFKIAIIEGMIKQKQIKSNFYLRSNYYIPVLENLSKFLIKNYNRTLEAKLVLLSILLGISYENILRFLIQKNIFIKYKQKKAILEVTLNSAYGGVSDDELYEIFESSGKVVTIELPSIVNNLLTDVKKELENPNSNINITSIRMKNTEKKESSVNKIIQKKIDAFLNKSFKNTIILKRRYLHQYSINYYMQTYSSSYTNLLFSQDKTSNMHTEASYTSAPSFQTNSSLWIMELLERLDVYKILDVPQREFAPIANIEPAGSNRIVKPEEFKRFITLVDSLQFIEAEENLNVKMICIRYMLAILLTTREYTYSASLKSYSKRDKILFLQEKARDYNNSKRVLPLTQLSIKIIQYFHQLKKEYSIHQNAPVLYLDKIYEPFTHVQVTRWLQDHEAYITNAIGKYNYDFLCTFSHNDLNFGRHIFKSISHGMGALKHDYVEAVMDHNEFGTNPHGQFSILPKQHYLKKSRKVIKYIQKDYIPYLQWIYE